MEYYIAQPIIIICCCILYILAILCQTRPKYILLLCMNRGSCRDYIIIMDASQRGYVQSTRARGVGDLESQSPIEY